MSSQACVYAYIVHIVHAGAYLYGIKILLQTAEMEQFAYVHTYKETDETHGWLAGWLAGRLAGLCRRFRLI